jgi:hypothetical protein
MFGGLPKLFDRSFFIGFFLPASLLFSGSLANVFAFGFISDKFIEFLSKKSTLGATTSIVIVWLLSILLMAFNRPIIRLLEGYGDLNPFRVLLGRERENFKTQAEPHLRRMNNVLDARRQGVPESEEFSELSVWQTTSNYPEEVALVLPTRLGNVMRAYERYSDVVYGIEAIVVWPRLFMLIPEQARERIRDGEALFHFAVNMLLAGTLTLATSVGMIIDILYYNGVADASKLFSFPIIAVLALGVFFTWFSWWVLPDTARQRGEQVKSTFDLYRSNLADALGLQLPDTEAEERRMWRLVSRRLLLRVADDRLAGYSKTLDDFRKKDAGPPIAKDPSPPRSASSPSEEREEVEAH